MTEYIIDDDFLDNETKMSAKSQGYLWELIRCKDCKHRPHKDERGNVVPPEEDEELSLCPCVDDGDWYYNYIPKDDWYCANGEPKEKE